MPPQALVIAGALGWNYQRSRVGQSTISMFARRHPAAFVLGWAGLNVWLVPHILRRP